MATLTVTLSGRAYQAASEGNWPNDCPSGWAALTAGTWRRVGRGSQLIALLDVDDAEDLADYLAGIAALWRDLAAEERGSDDPRPLERAAAGILAAR